MKLRIVTLLAVAGLAMAGCEGDRGPQGAEGPQGPPGTPGGGGATGAGLTFEIQSATVTEGQPPAVVFKATDPSGAAVDVRKAIQDGQLNPRFTVSWLQDDGTYQSYYESLVPPRAGYTGTDQRQAGFDPLAGQPFPLEKLTDQGGGVFRYEFSRPVTGVQAGKTHTVGMWGTLNRGAEGSFPASSTTTFVPAGGAATDRQVVIDDACNACHFHLQAHDNRRGVKLCLTCHNPGSADPETGNTVDMKVLVHKIHYGSGLPSSNDADPANDFKIVGFGGSVNDYTHVALPPSHSTVLEGGSDPGLVRDCKICHQGANADNYKTRPSMAACVACHDNIDKVTGIGHPVFPLAPAVDCTACHPATEIEQNHSVNYDALSEQDFAEHAYQITINDVTGLAVGSAPVVDFTVTLDGAPYDILTQPLGSLSFQMVPVSGLDYLKTGYSAAPTGTGTGATAPSALLTGLANPAVVTAVAGTPGRFLYAFSTNAVPPVPAPLPAGATGTYAFGVESYFRESKTNTAPTPLTVSKPTATRTPLFFKQVGDTAGTARTKIVSGDKCNACHVELGFHGNRSRLGVEYCGTCHNPNLDNRGRVRFPTGTTGYQVESVDIGVMSHRIHTGSELPSVQAGGSIIFGAQRTGDAPANSDFSLFAMPPANSTARCLTCHEAGTWELPAEDRLPVKRAVMACGTTTVTDPPTNCAGTTATGRTVVSELRVPRATAICTSCHDGAATIAHAKLNTLDDDATLWNGSPGEIETCTTCHGPGKDFDALTVHSGEIP